MRGRASIQPFWHLRYVRVSERHFLLLQIVVDDEPRAAFAAALELAGHAKVRKSCVEAYSNCKDVELFLNGGSLGRQAMKPNSKSGLAGEIRAGHVERERL